MKSVAFIGIGLIAGLFFLSAVLLRGQQKDDERLAAVSPNRAPARAPEKEAPPAPPPAEPAPSPLKPAPPGPIDLLGLTDLGKDAVAGTWKVEGGALLTPEAPFARLQFPCVPPKEYDLTFTAERQTGTDSLNIGLAVEGRQFVVIIDGMKDGDITGVDIIGQKGFMENETTFKGKLLPPGSVHEISCAVRQDRLTVRVNGRPVIDWGADYTRVSKFKGWNVPDARALFIGSYQSAFRVDKVVLTPVSGAAALLR